jgi:hypothetical protein
MQRMAQSAASDASRHTHFQLKIINPSCWLSFTLVYPEKGDLMYEDMVKLLGLLIALVGGGLAGSVVTSLVTRRRAKLDLSISLVRDFMSKYDDIAAALYSLNQVSSGKSISPTERNGVWSIGDWLEIASYLAYKRHCNSKVLKEVGLTGQAHRFRNALAEAGRVDAVFAEALRKWQYLSKA